jgi:hypothetical protein
LIRRARHHLNEGESVIVDASWIDAAHRAAAAQAVAETGNELIEFCCTCDDSVAAGRIERRRSRGDDASEATPRVRQAMTREMDAWPLATTINTSNRTPAECLSWALGELDTERQGAAEGP